MNNNLLILFISMLVVCTPKRDNPLDPESYLYTPPELLIDWKNSSVQQNETLYTGSVKISLGSNTNNQMEYRFKLKDVWSQWQSDTIIIIDNLDDGVYSVLIQKRYTHGTESDEAMLTFTVQALAQSAVYLYPKRIETGSELCTLKLCTKGIQSNCYIAHFDFKPNSISSFILNGPGDNRNALISGSAIDIIAFTEENTIKSNGEIGTVIFFTDKFSVNDSIIFECELLDSARVRYNIQEVRGSLIIKK